MLANMRLMQSFISVLATLPCVSSSQSTATSGQQNSAEKWPADDRLLRNQTTYKPRFAGYRDTMPVYNPRILPRVANDSDTSLARLSSSPNRIDARLLLQEDGACASGSPCTNGACCSGESGFCGYVSTPYQGIPRPMGTFVTETDVHEIGTLTFAGRMYVFPTVMLKPSAGHTLPRAKSVVP